MAKQRKTSDTAGSGSEDFVPVAVARTIDQAEEFRHLLEDHDIPVMVGVDGELDDRGPDVAAAGSEEELSRGIPVLVPESRLDEAGEVIAEREGFDRFADEEADDTDDDDELGLDGELPAGWSEQREDDDFVEDDDDGDDGDDPLSEGP